MQRWTVGSLLGLLMLSVGGCAAALPSAVAIRPQAPSQAGCEDYVNESSGNVTWEVISEENEIIAFIGTIPGSDFMVLRGAGTVDAPIATVANVLVDTTRHHLWVPHFGSIRVLQVVSDKERVMYRHVTTPIISDRDFVARVRISQEDETGHLVVQFNSVEHPDAPVYEGIVRGEIHDSNYRMWPIDGGKHTMVTFTIHADPKGSVPAWIVNLFQKGYARSNIVNIRKQATLPEAKANDRIQEAFADYVPKCGPGS